ncbi:MAG: hypothetical protein JWQ57_3521 [Mucilaginibacter sp.]|nr:hypothetical protein [Mucilaginibacter sp.]
MTKFEKLSVKQDFRSFQNFGSLDIHKFKSANMLWAQAWLMLFY